MDTWQYLKWLVFIIACVLLGFEIINLWIFVIIVIGWMVFDFFGPGVARRRKWHIQEEQRKKALITALTDAIRIKYGKDVTELSELARQRILTGIPLGKPPLPKYTPKEKGILMFTYAEPVEHTKDISDLHGFCGHFIELQEQDLPSSMDFGLELNGMTATATICDGEIETTAGKKFHTLMYHTMFEVDQARRCGCFLVVNSEPFLIPPKKLWFGITCGGIRLRKTA